jgi:ubiquinone/menaquinone biosynthesis C-methylase UbiE
MVGLEWKDKKIDSKLTKVGLAEDHKYRNREGIINFQQSIIKKFLNDYTDCEPIKVLDVSTGTGIFVELMNDLGHTAQGTEKLETPYKVFHKSQKIDVIYHDSTEFPFPFKKGEFDLVTCISSFNFYPEELYSKILKELFRISKKTVLLLLTKCESYDRSRSLFEAPVKGWALSIQGSYYRWDKVK